MNIEDHIKLQQEIIFHVNTQGWAQCSREFLDRMFPEPSRSGYEPFEEALTGRKNASQINQLIDFCEKNGVEFSQPISYSSVCKFKKMTAISDGQNSLAKN